MDEVDHAHFLSALELAWEACLKKNRNKIRIDNWHWYIIRGRKKESEKEYVL